MVAADRKPVDLERKWRGCCRRIVYGTTMRAASVVVAELPAFVIGDDCDVNSVPNSSEPFLSFG